MTRCSMALAWGWLALAGLPTLGWSGKVLAPPRPEGVPTNIVISIQRGKNLVPVNRDEQGRVLSREETLARAEPILRSTLGPNYKDSNTWKALDRLTDPEFAATNQRIVDLGRGDEARINLHPQDGKKPVSPEVSNTLVRVPGSKPPVYRPVNVMDLGEKGLDDSKGELAGVILHEAGHLGDNARGKNDGYGADDEHRNNEIISPSGAMQEGWGNYTGTWVPERFAGETLAPKANRPEDWVAVRVEGKQAGVYTWVPPWDRTAAGYLAQEDVLAGMLGDMEKLPGGREAVVDAFKKTNDGRDRSVADLLGAYAAANPDRADEVRGIVSRWTQGLATPAEQDALLAGRLPAGMAPDKVPFGPGYRPSAIPDGWDKKAWSGVDLKAKEPHPLLQEPDQELARRGRQSVDPNHPTYISPEERAELLADRSRFAALDAAPEGVLPAEAAPAAPAATPAPEAAGEPQPAVLAADEAVPAVQPAVLAAEEPAPAAEPAAVTAGANPPDLPAQVTADS